jgi:hypothetical protein
MERNPEAPGQGGDPGAGAGYGAHPRGTAQNLGSTRARIVEAAAALGALGYAAIPLMADRKPIPTGWPDAEAGADAARDRFLQWPARGVALVTRGVFVLDLDTNHANGVDGVANFAALVREHGEDLPASAPSVRSRRGGAHYYMAAPAGVELRSSTSKIAPGVDIKAGRALATCPPTPGYSWIASLVPPANLPPAPEWLVRLASPPPPPVYRPFEPIRGTDAYARAVLERELAAVASAGKGTRNMALFRAAARLGELAAAAMVPAETVAAGLLAAAEASGLIRDDGRRAAEATIASGLRRGFENPSPNLGGRGYAR